MRIIISSVQGMDRDWRWEKHINKNYAALSSSYGGQEDKTRAETTAGTLNVSLTRAIQIISFTEPQRGGGAEPDMVGQLLSDDINE